MKIALIGVGQAGGKIVDSFLRYDQRTESNIVRSAVGINTAEADLMGLELLPPEQRILVGQSHVNGQGVGGDNELAATIFEEDIDEIQAALDSVPVHKIDAFLVVAALGGGTGSGGAPVIIRHLKRLFTEPVYGLGVLPASDEGGIYSLNAARSLQTFVREADNLLLVDNDTFRETGESVDTAYEGINEAIARRFGVLFSAGEIDPGVDLGQSVVDSSEIINTLAGGGLSSVGYAAVGLGYDESAGLLSRFRPDEPAIDTVSTNRVTSLVRKATLGRLTLPCDIEGVERALVVVGGPPDQLDRKGIERARTWIEEETSSLEVRGGDYPLPTERKVAAVVVLSGITNTPRIEDLKRVAIEANEAIERTENTREENLDEMMDDGVDPLF